MDPITVDQFRSWFPAFADTTKYPDALIQQWIDLASVNFNPYVWGEKLQMGEALWVAHWLSVTGSSGTGGGTIVGNVPTGATSKKVGDTSVSYSDKVAYEMFANPYLQTPYGRQYWFMLKHLPIIALQIV